MISAPSGSSRRNRKACSGRSTRRNSGRAARSSPAASARRISCNAFLCWFETACRLVSAEMFVASYPLSQERLKTRDATPRTVDPLTRITMPHCCHHWNRVPHPYGYGLLARKSFLAIAASGHADRPKSVPLGRPNTTQTRPGIMLTCQSRHWRSDHD